MIPENGTANIDDIPHLGHIVDPHDASAGTEPAGNGSGGREDAFCGLFDVQRIADERFS